jgi:glutaminyl-tRNA synthetase
MGKRLVPFSREVYIEQDDFMENPPKKFFRLAPGKRVRLKSAYIIQCDEVIKDNEGKITELHCTYFPETKSGADVSGLKVQGTLHWVSRKHALPVELRLYDRLFKVENPAMEEGDFKDYINPHSLEIISVAYAEPSLAAARYEERYQFLRKGYFCLDKESSEEKIIFNRTVGLKDTWAKEIKKV